MSDFKAKMHQIRYTALPQTSSLDLIGPTSKGREGGEGKGRDGRATDCPVSEILNTSLILDMY